MANYNKVILMGNVTRKPIIKETQGGNYTWLGIAINKKYKNASGEWIEKVSYPTAQFWNKTAENIVKYLDKGSPVLIEGEIDTYITGDGADKKNNTMIRGLNIQFLVNKKSETSVAETEENPF